MSIRTSRTFLYLALGVSVLTNALLVMQNREYVNRMAELVSRQGLQKGARLRIMNGFDMSGSPVVLDFSKTQQPVVVLVVSASCGACAQSWRVWSTLVESLRRQKQLNRLVLLDITDSVDRAYASKHNIDGALCVTQIDPAQKWLYNLRLTPQTALVNPGGSVELVVSGIPDPDAIAEIFSRMRTEFTE